MNREQFLNPSIRHVVCFSVDEIGKCISVDEIATVDDFSG